MVIVSESNKRKKLAIFKYLVVRRVTIYYKMRKTSKENNVKKRVSKRKRGRKPFCPQRVTLVLQTL